MTATPASLNVNVNVNATTASGTPFTMTSAATTIVRYDYVFVRESCWIRNFFTVVYASSNVSSAICFALLIRFYYTKKYHRVHEKNLHSTCASLLTTNVLKCGNLLWKNNGYVNEALILVNVITTFLLLTAAVDLYLTLKSIVKDVFVEEAANRRRFALYSLCGWIVPTVTLRFVVYSWQYSRNDFTLASAKLHCWLNLVSVLLIRASLHAYYRSVAGDYAEGYKYYSDEKYTSNIVRSLSATRLLFYSVFLVSGKHLVLSIQDFFRAYEGMCIYYYLVVERRKKWSYASATSTGADAGAHSLNAQHQSTLSSSV